VTAADVRSFCLKVFGHEDNNVSTLDKSKVSTGGG